MECPVGRNKWVQALLVLFLVLGSVPNAFANTVVYYPRRHEEILLLVALLAESLFLALILIPAGFRWVRMAFVWMAVTALTWASLMLFLMMFSYQISNAVALIVVGEALVIMTEAVILRVLSASKSLTTGAKSPLRITSALGYSFLANAVSIVVGIVSFGVGGDFFGGPRLLLPLP